MPVRVLPEPVIGIINNGSQTAVSDSVVTTVATMTANGARNITKVKVSGTGNAEWTLVVDTVVKETLRVSNYSGEFDFGSTGLYIAPASVVDIKVEHFITTETLDFDATIYGY